jgi:uncharacterized protein
MALSLGKILRGPRTNEFYSLLIQAADITTEAASLAERRFGEYPNTSVGQEQLKDVEHRADDVAAEFISLLNNQYVAPFDRADLLMLINAIDDITDEIESVSELLGLYAIESPTRYALEQCRLLVAATGELSELLRELKRKRGSAPQIAEIKRLEDEGDRVKRDAVASLFKDDRIDPTIVIRWKDIYEGLEDAIDACETSAHLVGNLLVKNA